MAEKTLDTLFHDTLKDIVLRGAEHPKRSPRCSEGPRRRN
jgi:hypothetical protein